MDGEGVKIELTVIGASVLWSIALALLLFATVEYGVVENASRWATFLAAVAATWTVMIALRCSRRRLLSSLRYELQMLRDDGSDQHRKGRMELV